MRINLDQGPIDPEEGCYQKMLGKLQGNILRAHGRDHAVHIFLKFNAKVPAVRHWMSAFAEQYVTSAHEQRRQSHNYRNANPKSAGELFGNLLLSAKGYKALGFSKEAIEAAFPVDRENATVTVDFCAGMEALAPDLNDRPETWESAYRAQQIDAMILLAHDDKTRLLPSVCDVLDGVRNVACVLTVEYGHVLRNAQNDPIEPFGYVDSISQLLFLKDKNPEKKYKPTDRKIEWDDAKLNLVLLPDPFKPDDAESFGSFLVFRKLEQNIQGFNQEIQLLADTLGCKPDMAEALVMGRFKDGTPVTRSHESGAYKNEPFDYANDQDGMKCPFHAHIRKVNPRGEMSRLASRNVIDRERRIVRRGIPYGALPDTTGVGLLFMCFQRSLSNQFASIQAVWANSGRRTGSQASSGVDPVIGQPSEGQDVVGQPYWPLQWGVPAGAVKPFHFYDFVTLRGGEFLFAPSLSFLQSL